MFIVPDTDGHHLEISIAPHQIKMIPNSPYTKWFGVAECIKANMMIPTTRAGATTYSPDIIKKFEQPEHCLSVRFELTFTIDNPFLPVLAVRAIRKNQQDATLFIQRLDVASMNVGYFPLNKIKPNNMEQADGIAFSLYYTLFNQPCTMNGYKAILETYLPGFLKLMMQHMNHSISSYERAVQTNETGNKPRFQYSVTPTGRQPLHPLITCQIHHP